MKNDIIATVIVTNLLTPKDKRLLSKRSDELAVRDSSALSVKCTSSAFNMGQRLYAQTHQVESLMAEVACLKQELKDSSTRIKSCKDLQIITRRT